MIDKYMKLLEGAKGRLVRAVLATMAGWLISQVQGNELYIALGPALTYLSKKLHDKYPGMFDWLPF